MRGVVVVWLSKLVGSNRVLQLDVTMVRVFFAVAEAFQRYLPALLVISCVGDTYLEVSAIHIAFWSLSDSPTVILGLGFGCACPGHGIGTDFGRMRRVVYLLSESSTLARHSSSGSAM